MKKQIFAGMSTLNHSAWKRHVVASARSLSLSKWCVAISLSLILTACGDETTTNVTETTGMSVVKKGDKTPDCTADNEGEMVYVADSAAAFFCADGKWQSLKGEKGDAGEQGVQGEKGEPGEGKQGPKGEDGVGTKGDPGAAGKSCTTQKLASGDGYKIVCGGDSVGVVVNGDDGASAYELSGSTLSQNEWLASLKGENGTSCSATQVTGGVQIDCTDGTSVTLNDGTNGVDGKSFVDGWMVDPRDKQLYRVVTIRDQTWMAENMNYATSEGSSCYGNSDANCVKYGRLYTWSAAIGSENVQGACPAGWHIPTRSEWMELYSAVGQEAIKLKATSGWEANGNGVDKYGFSALPAGRHEYARNFEDVGVRTDFWTATPSSDNSSFMWTATLSNESEWCAWQKRDIADAHSVRCVKDSE